MYGPSYKLGGGRVLLGDVSTPDNKINLALAFFLGAGKDFNPAPSLCVIAGGKMLRLASTPTNLPLTTLRCTAGPFLLLQKRKKHGIVRL